jgi:hypothetical protein
MIVFHPPKAAPREYKIGKVMFTVNAHYCGFDNIYNRLAYLMQSELEAENMDAGISENPVDFEQD